MENEFKNRGLDLGLFALMNSAEIEQPIKIAALCPMADQSLTPPIETPPARNEYEKLADAGQWKDLLLLCEGKLSKTADSLEPRLWWISANLKTGAMPIALLAAPLDAATKDLVPSETEINLKLLTASTLADAAALLENARDPDFGISLLERARSFDSKTEKTLVAAIEREVTRISKFSGLSTKQSDEQSEKLKRLEILRATLPVEAKLNIPAKDQAFPKIQYTKPNAPESSQTLSDATFSHLYKTKKFPWLRVGIPVAAAIALAAAYFIVPLHFFSGVVGTPAFASASAAEKLELRAPALTRIESLSAFDGLYYDLKNVEASRASAPQAPVAQNVAQAAPRPQVAKQVLDIGGPTEPSEIQQAILKPEQAPEDKNAQILFGGAGSINTSESGSGPAEHSKPVQQFASKRVYRVVSHTKIFSDPQSSAGFLYFLEPGDQVSAEAITGGWLQIRSTGGRVGFIQTKDAVAE